MGISIHAPVRGAANAHINTQRYLAYFNPRARAGRGIINSSDTLLVENFNPRARAGRGSVKKFVKLYTTISIHAPVRGAAYYPYH